MNTMLMADGEDDDRVHSCLAFIAIQMNSGGPQTSLGPAVSSLCSLQAYLSDSI